MYRTPSLSVGNLSSVNVVTNTFTAPQVNVSVVNFNTVYANQVFPANGNVRVGGANVLNTTILGTSITLGTNTTPVSFAGTLSLANTTNVETRDQNVMINGGGTTIAGAGLTILSGTSTEIATARINGNLDWEFNSPSSVVKTDTFRVSSQVYTAGLVSTVSITGLQTIATTNSVTAAVLSLSGNLNFGAISVLGTTSTYGLSLNTMCAQTVNASQVSVATSMKWPNTITSVYLYSVSVPTVSASNISGPTISANALVVTTSLSIGTLNGKTVSAYLFTPEISSISVASANVVVSGTAVVNTTNVNTASIWSFNVANNASIPENKMSIVGTLSIGRISIISQGLNIPTASFVYISQVSVRFLTAGGITVVNASVSVGNLLNFGGTAHTIQSVSCTNLTLNGTASMSATTLLAQNAQTVAVGMSVLGRLSSLNVFVSDVAFMSLVSAVSTFANNVTTPSFPTLTTSVNASALSVISRTLVPSIGFAGAPSLPFRIEYNTVVLPLQSASRGQVAFTSLFATSTPSVVLQVLQGNADDVVNIVYTTLSSGGFQWGCTAHISNLYWIAAGP